MPERLGLETRKRIKEAGAVLDEVDIVYEKKVTPQVTKPSMKIVISRISTGIPRRNPISHATPADFPKLRVQPIHGDCLGTNVLESLRLK